MYNLHSPNTPVEISSIDDLRPAPYNPRKISIKAAQALSKSLKDFGDLSGIVWNKRTGNLVCGHQRVSQLKELGGQIINGAIVIASGDIFNIRVVDWPLLEEKTANVLANSQAISGEYTDDIGEVLREIEAGIGKEEFNELLFDDIEYIPNEDIDLGDGCIKEKAPTESIQVIVPAGSKKKVILLIRDLIEGAGAR